MIGAKFLLGHPDLETTPKGQHRYGQRSLVFPLPIAPEMKYQKEEGPSLKNCFELLREVSSAPVIDLARLLDAVIYNYLIGNNDAHGKNFLSNTTESEQNPARAALRRHQYCVLPRTKMP